MELTLSLYGEDMEQWEQWISSMEATIDPNKDNDTTQSNEEQNKTQSSIGLWATIQKLFQKLETTIERWLSKLGNKIKRLFVSNKGFVKEMKTAEVDRKPKDRVQVTTYAYVDPILDQAMSKMDRVFQELMGKIASNRGSLEDKNNPLNGDKDRLFAYIMKALGSSNTNGMSFYWKELQEKFRGEKKTIVIPADQIKPYLSRASSFERSIGILNGKLLSAKTRMRTAKGNIRSIIQNIGMTEENKQTAKRQTQNIGFLFSTYHSFLNVVYDLRTEEIMSTRLIIKEFYNL